MCLFLLRNANIIYNLTKKIELNTFSLELVFCGGFNLKRVKQKEKTRSVSEDGVLYFRTLPKSPKYDKRCIISRHTRKVEIWFPVPVFKDQNSKGIENSGSVMLAQFAKYLEFWGEGEGLLTGWDDPNTPIIILTLPNLFLLSTADLGWQKLDGMCLMDPDGSLVFGFILSSCSADCRPVLQAVSELWVDATVGTAAYCSEPLVMTCPKMLQRNTNCSPGLGSRGLQVTLTWLSNDSER